MTVAFEPAENATRVEIALQHLDETVVVEGRYETDDPLVIAALDAHEHVRRAEARRRRDGGES